MKASADLPRLINKTTQSPQDLIARSKYLQKVFPSAESVDFSEFQQHHSTESPDTWYNIKRSRAGSLPIYTEHMANGSVLTVIRKIEGNVSQLRNDIQAALNLRKKAIFIKDTSKQIVLKGNQASALRQYLGQTF